MSEREERSQFAGYEHPALKPREINEDIRIPPDAAAAQAAGGREADKYARQVLKDQERQKQLRA